MGIIYEEGVRLQTLCITKEEAKIIEGLFYKDSKLTKEQYRLWDKIEDFLNEKEEVKR